MIDALARRVAERQLSVRETEELVRRATERKQEDLDGSRPRAPVSAPRDALEEELQRALGTKVQIVRSRRGGRLIVHYYDDDQLNGLVDALLRNEE